MIWLELHWLGEGYQTLCQVTPPFYLETDMVDRVVGGGRTGQMGGRGGLSCVRRELKLVCVIPGITRSLVMEPLHQMVVRHSQERRGPTNVPGWTTTSSVGGKRTQTLRK